MQLVNIFFIFAVSFNISRLCAAEYEVVFSVPSEKVISTEAIVASCSALSEDDSDSLSTDSVIDMLGKISLNKDVTYKIFEFGNSGLNDDALAELAPKLSSKLAEIEGKHMLDFTYNSLTSKSAPALYNLLNTEAIEFIDICKNPRSALKYIKNLAEALSDLAKKDGIDILSLTRKLIFMHPKYIIAAKTKLKVYRSLEGTLLPVNWDDRHKEYYRIKKVSIPTRELSLVEYEDPNLDDPDAY